MSGRKIAVLRANGLGDFIFVLPALQALKASFPEDEVVYLGKRLHRELLEGRPGPVDRVIELPPYPGVGEDQDYQPDEDLVTAFFRAMRKEKFDVALQLHGGGRFSNPFLLQLGAPLNVGLQAPDAAALDINVPYLTFFSEIQRYLEVVSRLGARPTELAPRLQVTPSDRRAVDEALATLNRAPDLARIAVIHPGASEIRRRWPARKFATVARHLIAQGMTVFLCGSGEIETDIADEIMAGTEGVPDIHNLSGRLSIKALTGLLARADLMVANDSGPLHLAEALGVPSVGIYLSCNIINAMPMTATNNRPVIAWDMRCPLCGVGMPNLEANEDLCAHEAPFTTGVEVEDILEAIHFLLETHDRSGALQVKAVNES